MAEQKPNIVTKIDHSPAHSHRAQSLWQIWLPLGVVLLLTLGFFSAVTLATQSGATDLGQIQNAAVILIILPFAFIGVFTLIALILVIFGTSRVFPVIQRLQGISQRLDQISITVTTWSNRVMLPFVLTRSLRNRLSSKKHKQLLD